MGRPVGVDVEGGPGTGLERAVGAKVRTGPVGELVGAGEGPRVRTSLVIDATTSSEMPSASLAAASKAVAVSDDSMSPENDSDEVKVVSDSDTTTVKDTLHA